MSFADYDNDGDLDVMITGDGDSMELYRNNGDGTFTDVNFRGRNCIARQRQRSRLG